VRVRAASVIDARWIAEVHVRSWQAAYRGQVPDDYLDSLSVDQRETVWTSILQEASLPSSGAFVIEDDDRVIAGFADRRYNELRSERAAERSGAAIDP